MRNFTNLNFWRKVKDFFIIRTGTWSTAHALTTLLGCSIDKIHHGMQLRSHSNLDFWIQALTGKVTDQEWKDFFQGIFKNFSRHDVYS